MCTRLDQDYLQLHRTVHETDSSAAGPQRHKIMLFFFLLSEKDPASTFILFYITLRMFFKGTSRMEKAGGRVLNKKKYIYIFFYL